MAQHDEQRIAAGSASQYAAQLHKAQQNLKQFIPKYHRLVEVEKRLRQENRQLRSEIEEFNQSLVSRERECHDLKYHLREFQTLVQHILQEERRSPALHARPGIRRQLAASDSDKRFLDVGAARQDILPLNIWLVSSNRFIEQVIGYYARQRERLVIIEQGQFVRKLLEVGLYPDIILTGAYDFGLDDPFQQSFAALLDEIAQNAPREAALHACFIITLSASSPATSGPGQGSPFHDARHKYISKLHGLRVTISEVRFFLELRRCQPDILEPEQHLPITALHEATPLVAEVLAREKTGVVTVLSTEAPPNIRWALQCFFLRGQLVKTDHTLESPVIVSPSGELEILQDDIPMPQIDAEYVANPPEQAFFFPLYEHTVRHVMQQPPPIIEP